MPADPEALAAGSADLRTLVILGIPLGEMERLGPLALYCGLFLAQITPFFFHAIGGWFVIDGSLALGGLVAVLAAHALVERSPAP